MNRMVNNIQFACMLRTYKTYNQMVRFSKYEFNIYIYIYINRGVY